MKPDWESGYRWQSGLSLLSLDFLRPVYRDLGLEIVREETLRGMARDALLWRLRPPMPAQPQSREGLAVFFNSQVCTFLQMADTVLGDSAAAALSFWIDFVQYQENSNPWTQYFEAFLSWASDFRVRGVDSIGLSIDAGAVAEHLREYGSTEDARQILDARRASALTEWDFPLFKDLGLLEIPEGSDFFPFIDPAVLTIGMARFQRFWEWLISRATDQDIEAIDTFVNAKGRSAATHVPPLGLPRPPSLR